MRARVAGVPGLGCALWGSGALELRGHRAGLGCALWGSGAPGRIGLRAPGSWSSGSGWTARSGPLGAPRLRTGPGCSARSGAPGWAHGPGRALWGSGLSARTGRDLQELGHRLAGRPERRPAGVASGCWCESVRAPQSPPRGPRRRTTPSPALPGAGCGSPPPPTPVSDALGRPHLRPGSAPSRCHRLQPRGSEAGGGSPFPAPRALCALRARLPHAAGWLSQRSAPRALLFRIPSFPGRGESWDPGHASAQLLRDTPTPLARFSERRVKRN